MTYTTEQIKEMLGDVTLNSSIFTPSNLRFIAAAPAIVRQLLAELDRAHKEREIGSTNIGIYQEREKQLFGKIEKLEADLALIHLTTLDDGITLNNQSLPFEVRVKEANRIAMEALSTSKTT